MRLFCLELRAMMKFLQSVVMKSVVQALRRPAGLFFYNEFVDRISLKPCSESLCLIEFVNAECHKPFIQEFLCKQTPRVLFFYANNNNITNYS